VGTAGGVLSGPCKTPEGGGTWAFPGPVDQEPPPFGVSSPHQQPPGPPAGYIAINGPSLRSRAAGFRNGPFHTTRGAPAPTVPGRRGDPVGEGKFPFSSHFRAQWDQRPVPGWRIRDTQGFKISDQFEGRVILTEGPPIPVLGGGKPSPYRAC